MPDVSYVPISIERCPAVAELLEICFPLMPPEDQYSVEELEEMVEIFSAGTIVAVESGRVVGMGTGIFTDIDFEKLPSTENEILYDEDDNSLHDPKGDYYYGSDIAVHPDYRGRGIGRQLYKRRKQLVIDGNKKGFVAAAVLPGYENHKQSIDIHAYLEGVIRGDYFDPTLSMQMRNGFEVIRPLKDFFIYPKSDNWSALIRWNNLNYTSG